MHIVRDSKQGQVQSVSRRTLPASFSDFILIVKLDATLRIVCIIVQHSESFWLVFATLRVMCIKLDATLSVVCIKPNATLYKYMSQYIHAYTYIQVWVHECIHIYTCLNTYMHTHTYTHTYNMYICSELSASQVSQWYSSSYMQLSQSCALFPYKHAIPCLQRYAMVVGSIKL